MSEPLAYIVTGALMNCDKGVAIMPFRTNHRTTTVDGIVAANESDKIPLVNIPSFVMCTVGNVPCTPIPTPAPGTGHPMGGGSVWHDTGKEFSTVAGLPPVLFRSCVQCSKGGKISFLTTGQIPMPELDPSGELQEQIDDVNEQAQEMKEEYEKAENAVGESGLIEGFVPVWGSGRDAVNSFQQGKWGWGIFHSAMVVVDVVTLGTGTIVKGAIRGAAKMTMKEFLEGMAKKLVAIAAAKALAKEAIEKAVKETIERIGKISGRKLLTACFPAGTPIAVEGGFKNIEDIKKGDLVWSYNPDTLETGLKKVVDTHQSIADSTIKLTIGEEVIETTATHPFYTKEGWKDAGHLNTDDKIKSKNGRWEQIKAINLSTISKKVYNFTVRDWHTYFVGLLEWLVHNECREALLRELLENGIKHSADDIVHIGRNADGSIVFLERGSNSAGLEHILGRHADDFVSKGIPQDEIGEFVFDAATNGKIVGYQGAGIGRPIYEVIHNGVTKRVAVTVGNNGFIVGANPVSF